MLSPLLFALATTAAAMLLSSVLAALVTSALDAWRRWQRARAREDEIALLAATVQRWRLTPAEWGGAAGVGFEGVSLEAIGATTCPVTGQRRTANGIYSVAHVAAGPVLDRALARVGREVGTDGVLVIGRDPVTFETAAAIVLGPLLQVPLATVPWELITPTPTPVAIEAPMAEEADLEAQPMVEDDLVVVPDLEVGVLSPTAVRRGRAMAPDRGLALTLWPTVAPDDRSPRPRWPTTRRGRAGPAP